jgi:hypothetical protein
LLLSARLFRHIDGRMTMPYPPSDS